VADTRDDTRRCPHCGGDPTSLFHELHCDGQQGHIEADEPTLPLLASGLVPDTYATSLEAAESVEETKDTQRALVKFTIRAGGPAGHTDDEVQSITGLDGNSERPRRWELWKRDEIMILRDATGKAVRRPTRFGRSAVVWVLVPQQIAQQRKAS
jgi:hypothetical protein